MGILDRIENKLGGSSSDRSDRIDDQTRYEQQGGLSQHGHGTQNTTASGLGHTTAGNQHTLPGSYPSNSALGGLDRQQAGSTSVGGTASGITGGTAVTGGYGSDVLNNNRTGNVSSTTDQLRDTHLGGSGVGHSNISSGQGTHLGSHLGSANRPTTSTTTTTNTNTSTYTGTGTGAGAVPSTTDRLRDQTLGNSGAGYTNTGNTYGASQGRAEAGDLGSRRDADHPDVRRTQAGGISNNATDFNTGPTHRLENRDSVPTAGGLKVGEGATDSYDPYSSNTSTQHSGRDAALAGGVGGAAGYGAYEAGRDYNSSSDPGPAPNTAGPHKSDMLNKLDPRVTADPNKRDDTTFGTYNSRDNNNNNTTGSNLDRRTYNTTTGSSSSTNAGTYGQDVSYTNRPSADTPLTSSKDFNDRHHGTTTDSRDFNNSSNDRHHNTTGTAIGAAGVGAGAGALASGHHHNNHHHHHQNQQYPVDTATTSTGVPTSTSSSSQRAAGVDHNVMGSEMARRMGGAYESGYRDGYRDAMAHKASQV